MKHDELMTVMYTGSSMCPSLKPSDILHVTTERTAVIQRGDVIVFFPPDSRTLVVHRVHTVSRKGMKTRGDSNTGIDSWIINSENIIGRVTRVQRGSQCLNVKGGFRGHCHAIAIQTIRVIDQRASLLLHSLYHLLSRTELFRRLLPARMRLRILSFQRSDGTEFQLLFGRHVIGRLLPDSKRWIIRRPFRLFANESSLPGETGQS